MSDYIDDVFAASGMLARAFPGYVPRPGQIAMARAVDRAIAARGHLLTEAGCGVGKSIAYSVPAIWHAHHHHKPIVIVTGGITLQEQLVTKDLPLLRTILPWPFTFGLLKGRQNYLCLDQLDRHAADVATNRHLDLSAEERRQLPIVEQWANDCASGGIARETGDVSELPFEPLHNVWRRFSTTSEECKRESCSHFGECFAVSANKRARETQIVVTNYHMFYAHLEAYIETGLDLVVSPFEVAILDEGHKAASIARDVFGCRVSFETLRRLARQLSKLNANLGTELEAAAAHFFFFMVALATDRDRYKARLTGNFLPEEREAWESLQGALANANVIFRGKARLLEEACESLKAGGYVEEGKKMAAELAAAQLLCNRTAEALTDLHGAMEPEKRPRDVFFIEVDDKQRFSVCSKLIHPCDALTPGLFKKLVASLENPSHRPPVAVIATSATLATGEGDFRYVAKELGCPDGYESIVASSPFEWPRQCLFICPDGMPDPNAPEFKDAVACAVRRVIELARGRTLGLFTSRRVLDHTFEEVGRRCRELGITLLKQGDAPRTQLLTKFKHDISSVLLGTESFWAGVDVPGESLSVVVMDRLPFPPPDDPVLDVLSATDDNWFRDYSIPRAIIAFKQGFGRLIRSAQCRGVVVCLDNRLTGKRYGKQFLRALPKGVPKTTRLDAIAEWLELPIGATPGPVKAVAAPPLEPIPQLTIFGRPAPAWDEL